MWHSPRAIPVRAARRPLGRAQVWGCVASRDDLSSQGGPFEARKCTAARQAGSTVVCMRKGKVQLQLGIMAERNKKTRTFSCDNVV